MHWTGNPRHGVHLLSVLSLLGVAGTAAGQAVWTGPSGGGMMAVQEAEVLEPSHFAEAIVQAAG